MRSVFGAVEVKPVPVRLQARDELYYVYQGTS